MPPPSIRRASLAAGAIAGAWAGSATAQDTPSAAPPTSAAPTFSALVGAASDYLFRGVSRSDDRSQAFASFGVGFADGYGGVWASNAAFAGPGGGARAGAEIDAYGGWRPEFRGYSLDFGLDYASFTSPPPGVDLDYGEIYAKVSRIVGPVTARIGLHYSPAYLDHAGQAWYGEAGADYAIADDWTASAGLGYQTIARPGPLTAGDYLTWNAGVTKRFGAHVAVDVRYSDTDHPAYGHAYDGRLVGQIRASF